MPLLRQPSIKTLVTVVVVLPVVMVAIGIALFSTLTTRRIAEDFGQAMLSRTSARIEGEVAVYLNEAVRSSDFLARRVTQGSLPADDLRPWETLLRDALLTSPAVASHCFGNPRGDTVWLLRDSGAPQLGRVDGATGRATEYTVNDTGPVAGGVIRTYAYDPHTRPWYRIALAHDDAVWTPAYFWYGQQGQDATTSIGYTRALRDASGQLLGVLVTDVTLDGLNHFLKNLRVAQDGAVYVIDGEGLVVAASDGPVTNDNGQRVPLRGLGRPMAIELENAIAHSGKLEAERRAATSLRFRLDGEPIRAAITQVRPFPGIDWRVIAAVPEDAFMADANRLQSRAILLSAVALGAGLILALALSRRVTAPLLKLSDHVRRVGEGKFDEQLELKAARELQQLSGEINRMSAGLQHRMVLEQSMKLAMEVQQSLLPQRDPAHPKLDVAGISRYCDETGGDYYDFLEVASLGDGSLLIAVGDVMGHGIASALLMASARAALRAHTAGAGDLAAVMTGINRVLAADARHGRFMTMALVLIDPDRGAVRWASAGHDPTLVYDPRTGAFNDLQGGDLPLAVAPDTQYEEYRRNGLAPGATLVVGTDGIWEADSPTGEHFGKDRLRDLIRKHHAAPAADIAREIEAAIKAFRGPGAQRDDITFVVARLR